MVSAKATFIAFVCLQNEKSAQRRRKHCALAVVKSEPKIFAPPQNSRGRGMAKILSAGDDHYFYLQTQFDEDRCTQFRVFVVTNPQSHKIGPITTHTAPQLARSVNIIQIYSLHE